MQCPHTHPSPNPWFPNPHPWQAANEEEEEASAEAAHASLADLSLADIYARLEQANDSTAEARAAEILSGLLFPPEMQRMPTRQLSGGWRMRVALACSLFALGLRSVPGKGRSKWR